MEALLKALKHNGFAQDTATLNHVWANTAQDGQYSPEARHAAMFLEQYTKEYGHLTIAELKSKAS